LASTKRHNSWSDILALWGLRNRPPWLKTRSTGADVHGVQKTLSKTGFKHANLLSLRRCQGIPASVPSSISWMNARYEATIVGREMWITYNAVCIITHQGLENIKTFPSRPRLRLRLFFKTKIKTFISRPRPRPTPFFMSSRRLETKTKVSRLHLCFVSMNPVAIIRLGFNTYLSKTKTKTLMSKIKTETQDLQDQYWKFMTGMDCDKPKSWQADTGSCTRASLIYDLLVRESFTSENRTQILISRSQLPGQTRCVLQWPAWKSMHFITPPVNGSAITRQILRRNCCAALTSRLIQTGAMHDYSRAAWQLSTGCRRCRYSRCSNMCRACSVNYRLATTHAAAAADDS